VTLLEQALAQVEQQVAAAVPEGKRAAIIAVATADGAEIVTAARLGDHWQVEGRLATLWSDVTDIKPKIALVGSW
jgi:hypothetical protein